LESMGAISKECTMMACGQRQRTASRWDVLLSCAVFCVEVEGVDVGSSRGRAGGTHDHLEKKLSQGPAAGPPPRGRNAGMPARTGLRYDAARLRGQCAGRGKGSGGSSVAGRRLAAESLDSQRPLTAVGKRGDVSGAGQRPTASPKA
jgi:hypothetical protein